MKAVKGLINGRWGLALPEYRAEFHENHSDWEAIRLDSMFKNVKKGDIVIDVGSEEGDYPALFASWGAKVICIEPQPKYWPNIKNYFDLNKLKPLETFAGFAAVENDPHPARADFEIGYKGGWPLCAYGEISPHYGFRNMKETGVSTPRQPLNVYAKYDVSLITIDVEGAELEVLKSASEVLQKSKPYVYVSIHPEMMLRDWNQQKDSLFNYMAEMGYRNYRHLSTDHEEHWVFWHVDEEEPK